MLQPVAKKPSLAHKSYQSGRLAYEDETKLRLREAYEQCRQAISHFEHALAGALNNPKT